MNKTTIARDKAIADGGLTPLSFMLEVLRNPDSTQEDKRWAAVAAAPFMHPRLAHRQYSGPDGGKIVVQIVRFTDVEEQAADEPERADDGANGATDSGDALGDLAGLATVTGLADDADQVD